MWLIKGILNTWLGLILWIIKIPMWIIKLPCRYSLIYFIGLIKKLKAKIIKWNRKGISNDVIANGLLIWAFVIAPILVVWFVIWIWF